MVFHQLNCTVQTHFIQIFIERLLPVLPDQPGNLCRMDFGNIGNIFSADFIPEIVLKRLLNPLPLHFM